MPPKPLQKRQEYDIPKPSSTVPITVVEYQHPDYASQKLYWEFLRSAKDGSGGFAPDLRPFTTADVPTSEAAFRKWFTDPPQFDDTYLEPNIREGRRFERRVRRAWYRNIIAPCLQKIAGFLMKQTPDYSNLPPQTKSWLDSVSPSGLPWWRWLETELIPWAIMYGMPTAQFDRPSTGAVTRWEQEAAKGDRLTVGIIHPSQVIHWSMTPDGRYRWLKYIETLDNPRNSPLADSFSKIQRTRWLLPDGWFYCDVEIEASNKAVDEGQEAVVVDSGYWKVSKAGAEQAPYLQGAPLATWKMGETGRSMAFEAAQASRALYNFTSRRDNLLFEAGFPLLYGPEEAGDPEGGSIVIGTSNYFPVPEGGVIPGWIAPSPEPFEVLDNVIEQTAKIIEDVFGVGIEQAGTSGVAKSFDAMGLVRQLGSIAQDIAEGEAQGMHVAAAMHDERLDESHGVQWPEEFDAVDVMRLVEEVRELLKLRLPPRAVSLLTKKALQGPLADASKEDWDSINEWLDREAQVDDAADTLPDMPDDDEQPADGPPSPIPVPDTAAR